MGVSWLYFYSWVEVLLFFFLNEASWYCSLYLIFLFCSCCLLLLSTSCCCAQISRFEPDEKPPETPPRRYPNVQLERSSANKTSSRRLRQWKHPVCTLHHAAAGNCASPPTGKSSDCGNSEPTAFSNIMEPPSLWRHSLICVLYLKQWKYWVSSCVCGCLNRCSLILIDQCWQSYCL